MNTENINELLTNVRKAYRLLYKYQKSILDIMRKIQDVTKAYTFKNQSVGEEVEGWSWFSENHPKNGRKLDLKKWSWDWLNMYAYEFHFFTIEDVNFSAFLVSDNGYFKKSLSTEDNHHPRNWSQDQLELDQFANVENSTSYIILMYGDRLWHDSNVGFTKAFLGGTDKKLYFNNQEVKFNDKSGIGIFYAEKFEISDFMNDEIIASTVNSFFKFLTDQNVEIMRNPD